MTLKYDPRLSGDVQRALGEKVRESYKHFLGNIPVRFIELLRRLPRPEEGTAAPTSSKDAPLRRVEYHFANISFDPGTLEILTAAFDEAWSTLKQLGNETITREDLAKRLLELRSKGECQASRLAGRAITSLIAPQSVIPTLWGHEEPR